MIRTAFILAAALAAGDRPAAQDSAESFLAEALRSHGGAAALSLDGSAVLRGPVRIYVGSTPREGERTLYRLGRDRLKSVIRIETSGSSLGEFVQSLDGERAWVVFNGRTYDYPPDNLRIDLAHEMDIIARAASASSQGAAVKDLGAILSGERTLRGFEITEEGKTTRLLFDPATHLLAEIEYKAMENSGTGKSEEKLTRRLFAGYRPAGGAPFPHLLTVYKDGVLAMEWAIQSVEKDAAVDPAIFAKPEEEDERIYSEEFAN